MTVNYEAPFLYLLFGNDRALLLDTGATADATLVPLRRLVEELHLLPPSLTAWKPLPGRASRKPVSAV